MMRDRDFAVWQDKIAALTLDHAESTTVHILLVDARRGELIVDVLGSNRPYPDSDSHAFIIPSGRVREIAAAPAGTLARRSAPPADPCRSRRGFRFGRLLLVVALLVTGVLGGVVLLIVLEDRPYGVQIASSITYTTAAVLYTFGDDRGLGSYYFDCPAVRRELPRLAQRHVSFLIALLLIETTALDLRRRMPASWLVARGGHMPPFTGGLFILCGALLLAQVISNRSVLKRAHLAFTP